MRQRANLRTTLIRDVRMIVDNLKSRAVKDRRPLWFGKALQPTSRRFDVRVVR
jgi:hypothetical protein